jgi:hypothetical protein
VIGRPRASLRHFPLKGLELAQALLQPRLRVRGSDAVAVDGLALSSGGRRHGEALLNQVLLSDVEYRRGRNVTQTQTSALFTAAYQGFLPKTGHNLSRARGYTAGTFPAFRRARRVRTSARGGIGGCPKNVSKEIHPSLSYIPSYPLLTFLGHPPPGFKAADPAPRVLACKNWARTPRVVDGS